MASSWRGSKRAAPGEDPKTVFTVTVRSGDRDVLEVLYRSMNRDACVNKSNWLTDKPLHEWYRVRTDPDRGSGHRVTGLDLRRNNLTGRIPPETGNLDSLRDLVLSSNSLNGPIPPELGNLAGLERLGGRAALFAS